MTKDQLIDFLTARRDYAKDQIDAARQQPRKSYFEGQLKFIQDFCAEFEITLPD